MSQITEFLRRRAAGASTQPSDTSRAGRAAAKIKAETAKQLGYAKDLMASSFEKGPFKKLNISAEPLNQLFRKPGAAPSRAAIGLPKDEASLATQHQVASQLIDDLAVSAVQEGLFRAPGADRDVKAAMASLRRNEKPNMSTFTVNTKSSLLKSMLLNGYEIFPRSYMVKGKGIRDPQHAVVVDKTEALLNAIEANKAHNKMTMRNIAVGTPLLFGIFPQAKYKKSAHEKKIDEIVKFLENKVAKRDDETPKPRREVRRKPLPILSKPVFGETFSAKDFPRHLLDEDALKKK